MRLVTKIKKQNVIEIENVNSGHVVIWFNDNRPSYKLQRIKTSPAGPAGDIYAFVSLNDSGCSANDIHESIQAILEHSLPRNDIRVYENFEQFLNDVRPNNATN